MLSISTTLTRLLTPHKLCQVFEPSEIRARHLTEDDDIIRAQDVPERMQLATSTLSKDASLSVQHGMTEDMLVNAAMWVLMCLSAKRIPRLPR